MHIGLVSSFMHLKLECNYDNLVVDNAPDLLYLIVAMHQLLH